MKKNSLENVTFEYKSYNFILFALEEKREGKRPCYYIYLLLNGTNIMRYIAKNDVNNVSTINKMMRGLVEDLYNAMYYFDAPQIYRDANDMILQYETGGRFQIWDTYCQPTNNAFMNA